MAVAHSPERGRYFVEALGRGLALLDCFIDAPGPHSLIELSRRVGLGMPTTLRLIRTLEEAGYVRQDAQTKRYRLSWKMLQLQDVTASILDYADLARPHLEELAATVDEDCGMAVLDDTEVRHAIRVSANRRISVNARPGSVFPAHATAMGKVLYADLSPEVVRALVERQPLQRFTPTTLTSADAFLAEVADAAERGYAMSNGEWEPGLRSLAAPVYSREGRVVAAACVIVVRPDVSLPALERHVLPSLLRAAAAISADLGHRAHDTPRRHISTPGPAPF